VGSQSIAVSCHFVHSVVTFCGLCAFLRPIIRGIPPSVGESRPLRADVKSVDPIFAPFAALRIRD